jgi:hypothetical protein
MSKRERIRDEGYYQSKRARFLDEKVTPDRRPDTRHRLMKPRQVREYPMWFKCLLQYLLESHKDFTMLTVGKKADGHSVIFECYPNGTYKVYARTETGSLLFSGDDAHRFVTSLACSLRMKLMCELRALYDGREMGFLEVQSMLSTFKGNKMQNVGKFQLQLCPFGIFSLNPGSSEMSERACSLLSHEIVNEMLCDAIHPESTLASLVESTQYRVRLYDTGSGQPGLEFLSSDGKQTVARGQQEFFDMLIGMADDQGIEGFVLKADPLIFKTKAVVSNKYGTRDQSAVKVKREFKVTLLACRVRDKEKKRSLIYVYGLDTDGNIVYAGDHTKHERLSSRMPENRCAFSFKNKQEQESLYSLTHQQFQEQRGRFCMFWSSCTNMSKNRYCPIGLKIRDMSFVPLDLGAVSVLKNVAEANPHFRATRAASNDYALAIGRDEKKKKKKNSRKRKSQEEPPVAAAPKRGYREAPASLDVDAFLDAIGEQFQPPPREEVEPEVAVEVEPEVAVEVTAEPVDHKALEDAAFKEYTSDPQRKPYRVLNPVVRVFIDDPRSSFKQILARKITFLGGTVVYKLGPDVRVMVTRRQHDRLKLFEEHGVHTIHSVPPDMIQGFLRECAQD